MGGLNLKLSMAFIIVFILVFAGFKILVPLYVVQQTSASMAPTYNANDILFYEKAQNFEIGDVIIVPWKQRNVNVVSRIISKNSDGTFDLKADANPVANEAYEKNVKSVDIAGKVYFSMDSLLFYILIYGFQFMVALLILFLVSKKLNVP